MDEVRKSRVKVCFIQTDAYHLFSEKSSMVHGGSELQLYFTSKELSLDNRFQIFFVVGDFDQNDVEYYNDVSIFKAFNPKSSEGILRKILQAIKYYLLFKKINADIYFTSAASSMVGLVSLFCRLNKKKHVHRTAHKMDVDRSFILENGIIGKIYKYGLKKADLIFTQALEYKKLLKENHKREAFVLRNFFYFNKQTCNDKKFILWVARYEVWKRPELFLELAKCFSSEKFVMICPLTSGKSYSESFIKQINEIKNLNFIEQVLFKDIQKYFNKARIFVNTSDYEGFPNTFIQAGIGHVPILSLNVNPDNFIDKYNCGYYCNGDFFYIRKKMSKLLMDRNDWLEKSNNIFKYVKENHDIKNNIDMLKNIIFTKLNS